MVATLEEQITQLKNTISELRKAIDEFVNYHNNQRYHESLENMTPVDVFFLENKRKSEADERRSSEERWSYDDSRT